MLHFKCLIIYLATISQKRTSDHLDDNRDQNNINYNNTNNNNNNNNNTNGNKKGTCYFLFGCCHGNK